MHTLLLPPFSDVNLAGTQTTKRALKNRCAIPVTSQYDPYMVKIAPNMAKILSIPLLGQTGKGLFITFCFVFDRSAPASKLLASRKTAERFYILPLVVGKFLL